MEFRVIIPVAEKAHLIPQVALASEGGKTWLARVCHEATQSGADNVVVATDDAAVAELAETLGVSVCHTSKDHISGTEHIAEAVSILELAEDDIVVAFPGDDPLVPAHVLRELAEDLERHDNVKMVSACQPIHDRPELMSPQVVKVALNRRHYALYFSRAPIPFESTNVATHDDAHELNGIHFRHLGVYAYRAGFLADFVAWDPSPDEELELLEPLRVLWHGGRIHMRVTEEAVPHP
ncbi:MAG: 3-deoxy-D-manno-octulosonate cytidylyltransferase [Gammaproteobacteria bacterium RIFCSPHIGHO2_12_FULL_45_9]|nr:MAG: 3-deoxy-D-manno-octulosonate cytidylyltransferase [Gammaproteobacteria bacterium RIFCSPHIGHO2_12_FULL_45_9]